MLAVSYLIKCHSLIMQCNKYDNSIIMYSKPCFFNCSKQKKTFDVVGLLRHFFLQINGWKIDSNKS